MKTIFALALLAFMLVASATCGDVKYNVYGVNTYCNGTSQGTVTMKNNVCYNFSNTNSAGTGRPTEKNTCASMITCLTALTETSTVENVLTCIYETGSTAWSTKVYTYPNGSMSQMTYQTNGCTGSPRFTDAITTGCAFLEDDSSNICASAMTSTSPASSMGASLLNALF